ncbi:unnamed protein product [Rangifer tarandus platyrhynchus]|uniref:Uncharacterized protein n=1 Tax=Rangifer tarandus platyrhynchus TaxID=3082113 RepID=A0AC59Z445_RANTA
MFVVASHRAIVIIFDRHVLDIKVHIVPRKNLTQNFMMHFNRLTSGSGEACIKNFVDETLISPAHSALSSLSPQIRARAANAASALPGGRWAGRLRSGCAQAQRAAGARAGRASTQARAARVSLPRGQRDVLLLPQSGP